MNSISILLIVIMSLSMIRGVSKGFILSLASLLSLVVTIFLLFLLYPYGIEFFKGFADNNTWLMPLSIFVCLLLAGAISSYFFNLILEGIPLHMHLHPLNKISGILPGALSGLLYASIAAMLLLQVPFSDAILQETRNSSIAQSLSKQLDSFEGHLKPKWRDIITRTTQLTTIEQGSNERIELNFSVQDPKSRADLEAAMIDLVNQEREEQGLTALQADTLLREVARDHSRDMFARAYFSHNSPEGTTPSERARRADVFFLSFGENLAFAQNLSIAHEGLMKSPEHRANILNPNYTKIGIGILEGGLYGLMVTQNFKR